MCPMLIYIRMSRNPADVRSLFIRRGLSLSFRESDSIETAPCFVVVELKFVSAER